MTGDPFSSNYTSSPQFSNLHKTEFEELLASGELYAINCNPDCIDYGPWSVECDQTEPDTAIRQKKRFRAIARKAAIAAGAPARSNLLDWWVSRLARGQRRLYIRSLIQRSKEYCEELQTNAIEARALVEEFSGAPGLSRDRYFSESVPYWLYTEPHTVLSDAKQEFEHWQKHISQSFNSAIDRIATRPRFIRRWVDEQGNKSCKTREHVRRVLTAEIENRTGYLDSCVDALSYDLAVLRANYVIDRGYRGDAAVRTFEIEVGESLEKVRLYSLEASKRLGLSWRKLGRRSQDLARPFREVQADLRVLASKVPRDDNLPNISGNEVVQVSTAIGESQRVLDPDQLQTVSEQQDIAAESIAGPSAEESASPTAPGMFRRPGRRAIPGRRDAIRDAITKHGEGWRNHLSEIFAELDSGAVHLGDFQGMKIDLGGEETQWVEKWEDLDLAAEDQRRQIIDALRKYVDARGFNSDVQN